jgi:hypothetical protein
MIRIKMKYAYSPIKKSLFLIKGKLFLDTANFEQEWWMRNSDS